MAEVFISYSRKDIAFARILHQALAENGFGTWIDWQNIPPSTEWLTEVYAAIEQTDTFVFIISQNSLGSDVCNLEIAHAVKNNKRLIPVVIDDIDPRKVAPELAAINWLFFRSNDEFAQAFQRLIDTIETDYPWIKEHTRLQVRALEWQGRGRHAVSLLRGQDLLEAEKWLGQAAGKALSPTDLQADYIISGRRHQTLRQRKTVTFVAAAAFLVISALIVAVIIQTNARQQAEDALRLSQSRQLAGAGAQQIQNDLSLALLLALEAMDVADTVEARSSLIDGLNRSAYMEAILHGQESGVLSMAINPEGTLIATGSCAEELYLGGGKNLCTRGSVYLWDIESRSLLGVLPTDLASGALSLSFSPDGNILAVGGAADRGGTPTFYSLQTAVELWDVEARLRMGPTLLGERYERVARDNQPEHLAFSPDGRWLAVSGGDGIGEAGGTVTVWDVSSHQEKSVLDLGWRVTGLEFSPDGTRLVAASSADNRVTVWPMIAGEAVEDPLVWEVESPLGLAIHPAGSAIAIVNGDGGINLYSLLTGALMGKTLSEADHSGPIGFSSDGNYLAASGEGNAVTVWEITEEARQVRAKQLATLYAATPSAVAVTDLDFGRVPGCLVTGSANGNITLWDLARPHPLIQAAYPVHFDNGLAFGPGQSQVIGIDYASVKMWDTATGQESELFMQEDFWFLSGLALSPDGKVILACDSYMGGGQIYFWDVALNSLIAIGDGGHEAACSSVAFSPDGSVAASASIDGTLVFWDPQTGEPVSPPLADSFEYADLPWQGGSADNGIWSIAFSSSGEVLFTGRNRGDVLIWKVAEQAPTGKAIPAHKGAVMAIAVSPDGRILATAGEDRLIKLWTVDTMTLLGELVGHESVVGSLSFSPDGGLLVSAALWGGEMLLWDVPSMRSLGTIMPELYGAANRAVFNPAGDSLAVAGDQLLLWDLRPENWRQVALIVANRTLTTEERELFALSVNLKPKTGQ